MFSIVYSRLELLMSSSENGRPRGVCLVKSKLIALTRHKQDVDVIGGRLSAKTVRRLNNIMLLK